jgi:hypothetical protein
MTTRTDERRTTSWWHRLLPGRQSTGPGIGADVGVLALSTLRPLLDRPSPEINVEALLNRGRYMARNRLRPLERSLFDGP